MGHFDKQRKKRIQAIKSGIKESEPVEKTEIVAQAQVDFGLSEDKAKEYVKLLLDAKEIKETDKGYRVN